MKWIYGNVKEYYSQRISPTVGPDGTVYYGSSDDGLFAVRPDGTIRWKREGLRSDNAPAVDADGTIYYGSMFSLYAFSSDGSLKWKVPVNPGDYSSPAIGYRGDVYIGSWDGFLYAFSFRGELRWRHRTGPLRASPIVSPDGTVYVASTDGNIYAVTPWGTRKWSFGGIHGSAFTAPALGPDGTIYYWSVNNYMYAINPDGTLKWKITLKNSMYSSPAVAADGTIYVGSYAITGDVYAINPDGSVKWSFQAGYSVSSSPVIGSDGTIYIGCNGSKAFVFALNPDGSLKWKYTTACPAETSPAIAPDGAVYVGARVLYAFQTESYGYQHGSPWPGFSYPTRGMVDSGRMIIPELHTIYGQLAMPDSTPLVDVDVTVDGLTATTGQDGCYTFSLPDGDYTISFNVASASVPKNVRVIVNGSDVRVTLYEPKMHPVRGRLLARGGPVSGIRASVVDQASVTDSEGWYSFLLPDGKYTLLFDVGEEYFPGSKDIEVNGTDVTVEEMYLNHIIWRYQTDGYVFNPPPAVGPDGCSYLLVRLRRSVQLQEIGPGGALRRYYEINSPNPGMFSRGNDGTFYIPNGDEMIAVNPDFTLKWKYSDPGNRFSREPAIGPDGSIYFGSIMKMVYALNPDGTLRWKYPFSDRMEILPAIGSEGTVYVPGCDGKLYAFKPNGDLKWSFATGGIIIDTPRIGSGGVLYFGSRDAFLYAVNPDGTLRWKFDTGGEINTEAVLGNNGDVYCVNTNGYLIALSSGGELRWIRTDGESYFAQLWIYPPTGEIWAWSWSKDENTVTALKPTGEVKWREPATWCFPACASDGKIWMVTYTDPISQVANLCEVEMGEYDPHSLVVESEEASQEKWNKTAFGQNSLFQNQPNPFNPSTTISFTLPAAAHANLSVYDITGRKVRTLISGHFSAGTHSAAWDGRDAAGRAVSSGVYIARLESGNSARTMKMLLMR